MKVVATLVGIVSIVVNVAVSFMTDGSWKTAGSGLAQLYWNRTNRNRQLRVQPSRSDRESPFRTSWSTPGPAVRAA